jgi:glycerol uptake facilitator-like aquaporin
VAEALGTGFLLIAVVGSGILAERLAAGNVAIALLANALATAAALYALIEWLAPLSGAHFNPWSHSPWLSVAISPAGPLRPMCRPNWLVQ